MENNLKNLIALSSIFASALLSPALFAEQVKSLELGFTSSNVKETVSALDSEILERDAKFENSPAGLKSLIFSGDGGIRVGGINFTDKFSIEAVIKPAKSQNSMMILTTTTGGYTKDGIRFFINSYMKGDGCLILETGNGKEGSAVKTQADSIKIGEWQTVKAVIDRQNGLAVLYIDGKEAGRGSVLKNFNITPEWFCVGQLRDGFAPTRFLGSMEKLTIETEK